MNHQGRPSPRLYEKRGWSIRAWNMNAVASAALTAVDYVRTVVVGQDAEVGKGSFSPSLTAVDYFLAVVSGADASPGTGIMSASLQSLDYFMTVVFGTDADEETAGLHSPALQSVDYFEAIKPGADALESGSHALGMTSVNYV